MGKGPHSVLLPKLGVEGEASVHFEVPIDSVL